MIDDIISTAKAAMQKTIAALKNDLGKIRTGRASTGLIEHIMVEYYGNPTPLSQVANLGVEDARTITVSPWEKNMVPVIEKAIRTADLDLNPVSAGTLIRVPLPALTEERRKNLARTVRDEAEKSRVAVRNARRDANHSLDQLEKSKDISQDDNRRAQTQIQQLTDSQIAEVDKLAAEKEKDLMSI